MLPNLLAYGTVGAGLGHTNICLIDSQQDFTAGISQFGWVAGAGLEYKFYGNWIARAEYLHYDFDNTNFRTETIDVVRGGLSYKF